MSEQINQIKQGVEITEVAERLGIVVDEKTKRARCPFHDDKTPSLQFSKEKQICTCFSSNCNAGTMDVIALTEKKLNITTHEALKYLSNQVEGEGVKGVSNNQVQPVAIQQPTEKRNYAEDFESMKSSLIASSTARKYLTEREIDWKALNASNITSVGYNAFKGGKFNYLRGCVVFGLRDNQGQVVSLYGRSIRNNDRAKHYYTANRKGLYPSYPPKETKKLILTESIIDAATLLSIPQIKQHKVLALYGTNGLTTEHAEALLRLSNLREIILFLDGDEGGKEASQKHAKYLNELLPDVVVSIVDTPENTDINELAQTHRHEVFIELLSTRKALSFSPEQKEAETVQEVRVVNTVSEQQPVIVSNGINTVNPNKISYQTELANYFIKGGIRKDLDSLKVTLVIESNEEGRNLKSRNKLDLYEDKQTEKIAREAAEKLNLRADLLERDLNILTDLLDEYRESLVSVEEQDGVVNPVIIPTPMKEKCLAFLRKPNLLEEINELIGKSGVVGETSNRLFLFGIASSYKMEETLHALIQGSSGSGKTHLLATIMDFMPPEDTISLTRVTESSFYNYGKYELQNKLIGMEDYDGLEEKAELAFRELQSKGMISSSTSGKNEHTGEIAGFIKEVYGPIASLSATTKGEIYEDNMSRCFLVAVDESKEQTKRIIQYQNKRAAGRINKEEEKAAGEFLRNCMRLLKPYEVINPYADKIELPSEAHKIRRLNDLFQSYVKQVTLLNQHQRTKNAKGKLLTEKQDVRVAIEIMFDSIILKVDELDGSLRLFYESLKTYVFSRSQEYEFTRREIRHETKVSNTQLHRFMKQLIDLEYIYQSSGYDNRGHKYKIAYWDNMEAVRQRIKDDLNKQLNLL